MKLLTPELYDQLIANGEAQKPVRGTKDEIDFMPVVKLFNPLGSGTWLLSELYPDGPDIAFGLCDLGLCVRGQPARPHQGVGAIMTETFEPRSEAGTDHGAGRYQAELENALLAKAIAETGNADEKQALLSAWLRGTFNATMFGVTRIEDGYGLLDWIPEGDGYRLVWLSPTGLACPLARLYTQPDGSWAALGVAGVRDDLPAAMAAAEWAVGRLTG